MAGIKEMKLRFLEIPRVESSPFNCENPVDFAPNDQGQWLILTEVLLPPGVKR
jgi:hypothetical protein